MRPTHNNTEMDMAKFEAYGRWASLSEESRGFTLMSELKGGFDVHDKIVRMSLLKSSMDVDRWEDFGMRKTTYRAVFHNASWSEAKIPLINDELVHVPVVIGSRSGGKGKAPSISAFVTSSDDLVIVDTLKVAEASDGFIVRIYEASGGLRRSKITFPLLKSSEWKDAVVVNLLEDDLKESPIVKVTGDELAFDVTLRAFQILSLKVTRST
jgi:alpha-mannosidase